MKYWAKVFIFYLIIILDLSIGWSINLGCNQNRLVYSLNGEVIGRLQEKDLVRSEILKNAERDTKLLIFGLEHFTENTYLSGIEFDDSEGELEKQSLVLWASLFQKGLLSPIDRDRMDDLELEGVGLLCWRHYVEPSFFLKTLMESEDYQRVTEEYFFNYYLRYNSYLKKKYLFFIEKTELVLKTEPLSKREILTSISQGKIRLKNFEKTLISVSNLGSGLGHYAFFSIFSKVFNQVGIGLKALWRSIVQRGIVSSNSLVNRIITNELTWYASGGAILGSFIYLIKVEKDFEKSVELKKEILFKASVYRDLKYELCIEDVLKSHIDLMAMHKISGIKNKTKKEIKELSKLERLSESNFFRLFSKKDLIIEIKDSIRSDENEWTSDDALLKNKLKEMINYLNQYGELRKL